MSWADSRTSSWVILHCIEIALKLVVKEREVLTPYAFQADDRVFNDELSLGLKELERRYLKRTVVAHRCVC